MEHPDAQDGGYSKSRTCSTLVKILVVLVILALLVAVIAIIALVVLLHKQDEHAVAGMNDAKQSSTHEPTTTTAVPDDKTVCLSPGCAVAAARVYQALDTTVHPCDNFYDFACGNWVKRTPIPDDTSAVGTYWLLDAEVKVKLKALLEAPSGAGELEAITKAKTLYRSCLDEELIEKRGLDPLQRVYDEYGDWPLLKSRWDGSTFDVIDMLVAIRKYGSRPLISQEVTTDFKNSDRRIIQIDQPSFMMPSREYYLTFADDSFPVIKKFIRNLAEAFGAEDMGQVDQDIDDILEFETAVANMTATGEERRDFDKLYNLMTIEDMYTNITDQFDWLRLIGGMMNISGVEIPVTKQEPVIVFAPEYLKKVVVLIQQTSPRILANYLMASELISAVASLPKHIRAIKTEYRKEMFGGGNQEVVRWKRCVREANNNLGSAVGRLFVDAAYDDDAKAIASEMISNIRDAFNKLLAEQDWMDDATRAVAKEKADAMEENIGYDPRAVRDDAYLNENYKELVYDEGTYFENELMNFQKQTMESLKKLRKPVDKQKWQTVPTVVNAFYEASKNAITFPAGMLQPPFFSKYYPKSMNFGGIGVIIGHEITHGFDDSGRHFDKNGDLKTWWSDDISDRFNAKAQCMVHQYSEYTDPDANMNVNGANTQGENIADNGGLRQSYTAYRKWVKKQGKEEQKLPGLDYTPNQLFYISFAQVWCNAMRPQAAVDQIVSGVHSPGRFRVIGALQNSREFSEVFSCPQSSYMNPEKKCRVW